jgi:hypothetical protein
MFRNIGWNWIPEILPVFRWMKKKVKELEKNATIINILKIRTGLFHFILYSDTWLEKS